MNVSRIQTFTWHYRERCRNGHTWATPGESSSSDHMQEHQLNPYTVLWHNRILQTQCTCMNPINNQLNQSTQLGGKFGPPSRKAALQPVGAPQPCCVGKKSRGVCPERWAPAPAPWAAPLLSSHTDSRCNRFMHFCLSNRNASLDNHKTDPAVRPHHVMERNSFSISSDTPSRSFSSAILL